ncbi:hypothetical protein SEUCBS139899_002692 [Sporothrix eucalyptigena]|uniref:Altered inheritance of mitochondria protein 41 n=1 Tax=Sporothrix eucalyptigena TaxID=1812306 RepID=A0ABP0BAM6_9PEZI
MASRLSVMRLAAATPSRLLPQSSCNSFAALSASRFCAARRLYSSDDAPPAPPLLAKLKGDLKAAMKAKDKARLSVLRSVLAATLNASKTAQPIDTDAKLVALLRKTARTSQDAAAEFQEAGRSDLAEKEQEQIQILEAYALEGSVESLSPAEVKAAAEKVLEELKAAGGSVKAGDVIKQLLASGGPLDGKDFNKAEMAQIVKKLTA